MNLFAILESVAIYKKQGVKTFEVFYKDKFVGTVLLQEAKDPIRSTVDILSDFMGQVELDGPYAMRLPELAIPELAAMSHLLK